MPTIIIIEGKLLTGNMTLGQITSDEVCEVVNKFEYFALYHAKINMKVFHNLQDVDFLISSYKHPRWEKKKENKNE